MSTTDPGSEHDDGEELGDFEEKRFKMRAENAMRNINQRSRIRVQNRQH